MSKATKIAVSSVLSLALLFTLGFGGYTNLIASAHTFISVDINPSVDLELNAIDQVIAATPNNGDAETILAGTDLSGMNVSDAISTIAGLAVENGYLDPNAENSILVSGVDNTGSDIDDKLDTIQEEVQKELANRSIKATVLSEVVGDELKALADETGVTPGKLLLMEKAVRLNPDLDLETISDWSIAKISRAIKDAYTQIKAQNKEMTIEQAMANSPVNAEQLQAQLDRLREKTQSKLQKQDHVGTSSSSSSDPSSGGTGSKNQGGKKNQGKSSDEDSTGSSSSAPASSGSSSSQISPSGLSGSGDSGSDGSAQLQNQSKPDSGRNAAAGPKG